MFPAGLLSFPASPRAPGHIQHHPSSAPGAGQEDAVPDIPHVGAGRDGGPVQRRPAPGAEG